MMLRERLESVTRLSLTKKPRLLNMIRGPIRKKPNRPKQRHPQKHFSNLVVAAPYFLLKVLTPATLAKNISDEKTAI